MAELMRLRLTLLLSALSSVVAQLDHSHTLFHLRLVLRSAFLSLLRYDSLPLTLVGSIVLRCYISSLTSLRQSPLLMLVLL
jgi:hypothetical protein